MILDKLALLSDAQNSTVSVASTDYIDTLAKGQAYDGCHFVVRVDTSFASQGTTTCTFQLQTSDETSFGDSATLAASSAFVASQLTAGKFWAVKIPSTGVRRYIRGYKVMSENTGGNYWTAAIYDMFIVKDIDVDINQRYAL